jgi:hypothetical protein
MPFSNLQETGKPVSVKDEGLTITPSVASLNFVGSGVTGTNIGDNVTATIPGGGGTGFTKLTATGTVNSVNADFTFTEKPTYIVSDGLWYVENTGWTWAGSTATMTVPPNDLIYGFV